MHIRYVHCSYYPKTLANSNLGVGVPLQLPTVAALNQFQGRNYQVSTNLQPDSK